MCAASTQVGALNSQRRFLPLQAEYIVALFMYMRLIGYPADKISILTTYNGQKHLIRDVIKQRCQDNPLIGQPHKVTTVDRFQGQQNDYILLSLVRTKVRRSFCRVCGVHSLRVVLQNFLFASRFHYSGLRNLNGRRLPSCPQCTTESVTANSTGVDLSEGGVFTFDKKRRKRKRNCTHSANLAGVGCVNSIFGYQGAS